MKRFVNKILDVPKLILTIWIILWAMLIILLVMKFCFGMWYPIVVENEWFINMCNFIDNNKWLYMIFGIILYIFSANLTALTNMGKTKYDNWIYLVVINLIAICIGLLKNLNIVVINIIEAILLIVPFIIININKNNFKNKTLNILVPIIIYCLLNLWQLTILIVRGQDVKVFESLPILMILILQIDYYIFLTITWIGVSYMGIFSVGWFFGKDITTLKAEKEKELAKAKPNMKKVESLDIRIAELEKEGK